MDIKQEQVQEDLNNRFVDQFTSAINRLIDDTSNIDLSGKEVDVNDVMGAEVDYVHNVTITDFFEDQEGFTGDVEISAFIDISDFFAGEKVEDSIELTYSAKISGESNSNGDVRALKIFDLTQNVNI